MSIPNQPVSEQFRLVAKRWVEADAGARLAEETKNDRLMRLMQDVIDKDGKMPNATAERLVRASDEWRRETVERVRLRTEALRLKVQLDFIKMQASEQMSFEASRRAEMKL
jgi:hypothetical protein